jgi:exosortase
MVEWIVRRAQGDRARVGTLTGMVCILANVALCAAKGAIGVLSGSVSIVADAMNNLSDASSNIVSVLGFKLASKPADPEHPYGHGRYEYLSGLVVAALVFTIGGGHLLRVLLPAVVFLGFMLPLPPSFNALLARPLQTVATDGSVALLQLIGVPVIAEGNVIITSETPLEVARACNGLSMMLSFVTLVVATVLLVPRPWPERIVLLLSAVPIAVLTNILRITVTAVAYRTLGAETADAYAHDYAGYAMMPVALALVWLELKVCSRLFVEVENVDPAAMIRRRAGIS